MRWKCSDLCGSLRLTEGSQLANGRHPSPLKWLVLVVGNLGSSQLGAGWAVLTCCGRLWMASWGQFDRSISYSLLIACLSSISPPKPWLKYYFHWKNCSDFYLVHLYRVSFFSLPTSNHNNWHLARISINQMLGKTYLLDMVLLLCEKWEKLGQMKTKQQWKSRVRLGNGKLD